MFVKRPVINEFQEGIGKCIIAKNIRSANFNNDSLDLYSQVT